MRQQLVGRVSRGVNLTVDVTVDLDDDHRHLAVELHS
jgi:hypothetical protein